ncbi:hypothetical protein I5418_15820 [Citrobacter braakii]|uniref:hypothetical protein n=1 Tax=Citrobacter braakii TaxID=57706 RepID=UPI0019033B1E|nr:hypothetical protein [Citrobacter braakii]MBJ8898563.1 hypothetical protein [Citrobacter braakii]
MATNMITDGSFDPANFGAWSPSSPGHVSNPEENNYYCHIDASASVMQQCYPAPNVTYKVTFMSRGSDGGTVSFMESGGLVHKSQKITSSADWQENTFEATSDTTWGAGTLLHFQATDNGALDIDNVIMVPAE